MSTYSLDIEWLPEEGVPYKRMARLSATPDGLPDITVVTPPEFKKGIPNHWNPEHLFVASSAACFFTTFLSISDASNLALASFRVSATGTLGKNADGQQAIITIDLHPVVKVQKDADVAKAEKIIQKAENNCLISNSMKTTVSVHPAVRVA